MLILHVYFWFKCSLLRTTATACTIFVEFFCAIVFPMALPDTVSEATNALIKNCMLNEILNEAVIFNAIEALIEPLKTPHISPITSAQKFATLAEFLINFTDVLEPAILFDAFAWNSFSSATVTATPIISKNIPINITKNNINTALEENFSGDNLKTITIEECIKEIDKLKEEKEKIIEENYAIAKEKLDCYKNYINIPEGTQTYFEWVELFKLIKKSTDLIEEQCVDIKAKYDWIQKIEKDNNDLREKIGELEERIKQNLHEEKKLEEKNEKIKEELKEVYNSKRWKYTEKLSNFFHKKLK